MTQGQGRVVAERYRLVTSIGRGGMGVVWRAHDEYLHRDVAIKELRLHESADPGESEPAVRRMLREARAAAQLRHPGIVTVHDVVTEDGLPWIVMELIGGRSLADILDHDGPLPVDQAAQVGIQILRALDAAHQRGVLHRDVKPGNIMLDGDRVVLTDFGIAMVDGASALTGTGQMPGSPEYIAPERIDGHEATRAADLWSVGVTLYGAVVGRSPFKRKDIQSTLAAAASREPDPDQRIGRLWPVIQGLLRKQPAERMTAVAAIERLTAIAATLTPHSGTPTDVSPTAATQDASDAMTWIDNASSQVTDVDPTAPNTRTAPPPLMPVQSPAGHGDITLDPISIRPPRKRKHGLLLALGAAFTVAVVVLVVILVSSSPPQGQPGQQPTVQPRPVPSLVVREATDFQVQVPVEWETSTSMGEKHSDVIWSEPTRSPADTFMRVQVRRDENRLQVPLSQYLTAFGESISRSSENRDYKEISRAEGVGTADLEYQYTLAASSTATRVLSRAFLTSSGKPYVLSLVLYGQDEGSVRDEWQARRPLGDAILRSFRLTP
nr:serine/threonine-protein kinase [Kibdelosporangium sp. MJ126-NF4]CEL20992.1 serine/threonine protein kinase [Kibdelosporangium sp. MJ126-NF4]CTQ95494.1 serine/threonine protein kinase [Kibdelosporangium sp. MJ126-NF4]